MSDTPQLRIDGEVERPTSLTWQQLQAIAPDAQVADVSEIDPKRKGTAVRLASLLELVGAKPTAAYLGLHATHDDFHASVPLEAVRDRGLVIYQLDGQPLPVSGGGPIRFFIPDHAACHTSEIDECANVKFIDRIELQAEKGFDNRPDDDQEHEQLHREQEGH